MNKFNVVVVDWTEDDGYVYEFECIRQFGTNTFIIVKKFEDGDAAEKYAKDYDCIILHNVRVRHKVKK